MTYLVYGTSIGQLPVYGPGIPGNKPATRAIDMRSLDYGASGPEQPYPVYQFSGYRTKWEYPDHDPFLHVPPYF